MTTDQSFPIIDAHHHLWDLSLQKHPWLCQQPWIASRYGDYAAIRHDYLLNDYLADASKFDLVKSVYVETEWDPNDPLGEVRWVKAVMQEQGRPNAVVAQAWLDNDGTEALLADYADSGVVRGVRHKPTTTHSRHIAAPGPRGSMSDARWRNGFALLDRYGLSFELQAPYWHLPEAAELARDFPSTTIIVNHTGLPSDRSQAGLAMWRECLATLAKQPNTALKISGLGRPGHAWTVEANRGLVLDAIALFGVERCMFASNFPVDRLCADFTTIMGGFRQIVAELPLSEQHKLFHDNAVRYYHL